MGDLPTELDVVVLGTGVPESMVAAACARVGKSVIHFDSRNHYGSLFASFNFNDLRTVLEEESRVSGAVSPPPAKVPPGLKFTPSISQPTFSNVHIDFGANSESEWTLENLEKNSRRFNLDLAPKLLFARGKMVELLISSNIAKYAEFKLLSKVLTLKEKEILLVPCSRADVFATDSVNVVEKRALMRFITNVLDYENQPLFTEWLEKPFVEFIKLKALFLSDNLQHFLQHSIAMAEPNSNTKTALENARKFITSLGRYGNSPFLSPIYGCGELAQCFCRLCAVFGGVYHLDRKAGGYFVDENNHVKAVLSEGTTFKASHVVINQDFVTNPAAPVEDISRAIVICRQDPAVEEQGAGTLLRVPPSNGRPTVTVIEQGAGMMVCPKGLVIAHFICRKVQSAKEDLESLVEEIYPMENRVWTAYFNMIDTALESHSTTGTISELYTMSTPGLHLDYDFYIEQSEQVFRKMYPTEEFLPRAPDPEEIILDFEGASETDQTAENARSLAKESESTPEPSFLNDGSRETLQEKHEPQ